MAADGASRPSVDGSRPTSRFHEGSMNDRISAAPPVQFLGPEEAAEYERQFYNTNVKNETQRASPKRSRSISRRRERPLSAQANMQSMHFAMPMPMPQPQEEQATQNQEELQAEPTHKRVSFLGRVRDALFGKPNNTLKPAQGNVQNEIDKRTSLQQPPTSHMPPQARPMPIPTQGGMPKSQSSSNIPQLPASFHGGGSNLNDRPSRDEIMASYNELMATGFFKAHAIQSTRQPAPGTSLPNQRRAVPPLPTIPSPSHLSPGPNQPSFNIIPPSRDGPELPVPPMPCTMPPPPPLFAAAQIKPKPSWESFRKLRGRKRTRVDSDDNTSESASMMSQQLPSSTTSNQITTQVSGIGRRVSKKLRKMPSALADKLQTKSDNVIRLVPESPEARKTNRIARRRSPSPSDSGTATNLRNRVVTGPGPGSSSGRLRKGGRRGKSPSRPPVSLDNYPHLDPSHMPRRRHESQSMDWEPMDIDGVHSNRVSVDSVREYDLETVHHLLKDDQLGVATEPLSVVPDMNKGIPSVPHVPGHFKCGRLGLDENAAREARVGEAM